MDAVYHCDGVKAGPGGAYQGHMLPGVLFVMWSVHWLQGSMRHFFACKRSNMSYQSLPHYGLPGVPPWPLEPLVKIAMALLGATLEVTWHDDGFQNLVCRLGTARVGHFDGDHINNWQHVQMYACFLVSGVIDLIGYYGLLPAGTEKAMLSLAFAGETILMGLHEKEEPLDRFLHQSLASAMLACCLACALEAAWPASYIITCARTAGVMLQGCLFIIIAQIMFQPHVAWTLMPDDTAPLQVAKVIVIQTMVTIMGAYAALHIVVQAVAVQSRSGKGVHTGLVLAR